jgi:Tfp pilus assembly protein PilX
MTTPSPRSQRGVTLLVALIMLVVLTLFVTSALNTSKTNLQVVGNMQARAEALASGQQAIESVLSTTQFISSPTNAVATPCGAANTLCSDASGAIVTATSAALYITTLTPPPACVTVKPIKNSFLILTDPEDLGCSSGQQQQFGVAGAVVGDSLCSNSVWEISSQTNGVNSAANVKLVQGIGVRISADDAAASCGI